MIDQLPEGGRIGAGGWFAALFVAVLTIAGGLQTFLRRWKGTSAENQVIDLLRTEVQRLGAQNAALAKRLNQLQSELVQLNEQLGRMTIENNRLHVEVARLTAEVTRLQGVEGPQ